MIVMVILIAKLDPLKDAVMQWHNQAINITTNLKVKIYFTLPEIGATNFVTCNFHVDDSDKGRYDIIPGRELLEALGLNLNLFEHAIKEDYGPLKGSLAPMVDLGLYELRHLNTGVITPK